MDTSKRQELWAGVRRGVLQGLVIAAIGLPLWHVWQSHERRPHPWQSDPAATQPAGRAPSAADFGDASPSPVVRALTQWVVTTRDNGPLPFVVLDKTQAHLYIFAPEGRLIGDTAVLLGSARGDDTAPGIGKMPINQVAEKDRTTPAGRFVAEPGRNARHETVVWVDYDAAVSMHRVLTDEPGERRLQRLATPTASDNRISHGCINVPTAFFEQTLWPTLQRGHSVVYVVPEVRSLREVFPGVRPGTSDVGV